MKRRLKFILPFLLISIVATNVSGQKLLMKQAGKLYSMKAYADAIPYYEDALKMDSTISDALVNIADCYRLINNSEKAVHFYAKVVALPCVQPVQVYYYAQALMQTGNYDEAKRFMGYYRNDERGKIFKDAISRLNSFYKDTAYCRVRLAPFNSAENDFSPVILNDNSVVFVSARNHTQVISYTHSWTDRKYYSLYACTKLDADTYTDPAPFASNIETRFNDGPFCFDNERKTVYITRNNLNKGMAVRSGQGVVTLNIYAAEQDTIKNSDVNIHSLSFNSSEYNTEHPALSGDGKRLYFSSDMAGTFGGMDLWVCYKQGREWSKPVNLGKHVNTSGDEVFPYVLNDSTLCFSSSGLAGIGGLDLFQVILSEQGLPAKPPDNMGIPMNSPADDFGIAFRSDGKSGLFSSNRATTDLNDDIYEFVINRPEKQPYILLVKDSATKQLINAYLTIDDTATGQNLQYAEVSGRFELSLYPNRNYIFSASAGDHKPKTGLRFTTPVSSSEQFEIQLAPDDFFIKGTIFMQVDDTTTIPVDSAIVVITDGAGDTLCSNYFYTDINGNYKSCNLDPDKRYFVTAYKKCCFARSSFEVELLPGGSTQNLFISEMVVGQAVVVNNIYFDLAKWNIRPDAAHELDKVVRLMKDNPAITMELSSHTDCRADAHYNLILSDKRAKASAEYIISKGIDRKRITAKGYGESRLLTDCRCGKGNDSDCTDEEHARNRRTEFKVTGYLKDGKNVTVQSNL